MSVAQTLEPTQPVSTVEAPPATPRAPAFSPEEQAALHAEDRHAGRIVAGILTGILTLGLILYVVVLFIVSS